MIKISPKARFQRELINSVRWDDLLQAIVHYPSTIMAAASVYLFVRNLSDPGFSYATHWFKNGASPTDEIPNKCSSRCGRCLTASSQWDLVVGSCLKSSDSQERLSVVRYCAPLVFRNEIVAILQIYLPAGTRLSSRHIKALAQVLPEMSMAIANFRLQHMMGLLVDEAECSRRQFAQDLHDNLAQTIAYLRLKLDQFNYEGTQLTNRETQTEIERMRDAADEAYALIRGKLAELEPADTDDLMGPLSTQADVIGQRYGFEVQMTCSGVPIPVASTVQRHVQYICCEALNNTGRHAGAQSVEIHLQWGTGHFTIDIRDDGSGFVPSVLSDGDHFGLAIMERRARSIGGTMTIRSSLGNGTQLYLWSPASLTAGSPH